MPCACALGTCAPAHCRSHLCRPLVFAQPLAVAADRRVQLTCNGRTLVLPRARRPPLGSHAVLELRNCALASTDIAEGTGPLAAFNFFDGSRDAFVNLYSTTLQYPCSVRAAEVTMSVRAHCAHERVRTHVLHSAPLSIMLRRSSAHRL
jgi:hypothetical protein